MSGDEPMPDAEVDRHFAELVERYYDNTPPAPGAQPGEATPTPGAGEGAAPAADDEHIEPVASPGPRDHDLSYGWLFDVDSERFVPDPPAPLPRMSTPALVGALLITSSAVVCLLAVLGLPLPGWAGWLAVTGFAVGMALLLSRLPRHRDPEDGDGAVL